MKKTIFFIAFISVLFSCADFLRLDSSVFLEGSIEIENMDSFEESSSEDEEDGTPLMYQELISRCSLSSFESLLFITHSHLFDLHSPPPEA